MVDLAGILVVIGWLTSLAVAVLLVPRIAAKRVCEQFGLQLVSQGGKSFYVPLDPHGDPVQVPIGTKEIDGKIEPVMGYAPLAYSLPVIAAEYSAQKVFYYLRSQKGHIAKALEKGALESGMVDDVMMFLPKKWQAAYAVLNKVLGGNGSQKGTFQSESGGRQGSGTFNPGLR